MMKLRIWRLSTRNESAADRDGRRGRGFSRSCCVLLLWAGLAAPAAGMDVTVDASYGVTLAGLPIGVISGSLKLTDNGGYHATASGAASGLLLWLSNSHGEIDTSGSRSRGDILPSNYSLTTVIRGKEEAVRAVFADRNVKDVSINPPPPPNGDLLPITEAHRRKVLDPLTAALVSVPDKISALGPETCQRTIPVFDGRVRYDLKLAFKRITEVATPAGYKGPAVVCEILFVPIAGHDPNRFLFKYLAAQRNVEAWLVPVAGTGLVIPYRISIPTPMGLGVMEAKRLETQNIATANKR